MNIESPTLIIDSNFLVVQSFFVIGDLSFRGEDTGVIYGFLSRLLHFGEMFKSNEFVFCWDSRKSRRRELFPGYKNRTRSPQDEQDFKNLYRQAKTLRRHILPDLGFPNQLRQTGYEADDLICTLVRGKIGDFVIISGDEDFFQCLQNNVRLYFPGKKQMWTRPRFRKEYQIDPREWPNVKAIAGCPSDTIPGIEGVGIKTSILYLNRRLNPGKKLTSILEGQDIVRRNRPLVCLPFPGTKEPTLKRNHTQPCFSKLIKIAKRYGLHSFLEETQLKRWKAFFEGDFDED